MGKGRSSSSSSIESSSKSNPFGGSSSTRNLSTDLRLGLSFGESSGTQYFNGGYGYCVAPPAAEEAEYAVAVAEEEEEENECNSVGSFYVKVNMEGVPIGRKIDLLSLNGYHDLIGTLDFMFNASILWAEDEEEMCSQKSHVLTYADKEGDWMMVGDVPWEMFLSTVRRLKISRAYHY